MKICLVTNLYEPHSTGGADIYVKWLAEALKRHGHEPFVVTTCPPRESFPGVKREVIDGISVYRFFPLNIYWGYLAHRKPLFLKPLWHSIELWNPHVYLAFKDILSKESPDIVHINNMGGFSNSIFWATKNGGCKLVYTLHDYLSVCPKSVLLRKDLKICTQPRLLCRFYQKIKKWNLKNTVDIFISPSQFLIDMHKKYGLLDEGRHSVIPQGVEISFEDIEKLNKLRGNYGSTDDVNVLFIGRVEEYKGVAVLARAFKEAGRGNLSLHVAGSGDFMRAMLEEVKGCHNVKFYGWVSGVEKEKLFLKSDVCVLPSTCYDNAPLVLLEAYKHGLPVIGSRIGGIPEMIEEHKTGFLFQPGDEAGLAEIFRSISKRRLSEMAGDCQEAAMSRSMNNHFARLMTIYTSLAESKGLASTVSS